MGLTPGTSLLSLSLEHLTNLHGFLRPVHGLPQSKNTSQRLFEAALPGVQVSDPRMNEFVSNRTPGDRNRQTHPAEPPDEQKRVVDLGSRGCRRPGPRASFERFLGGRRCFGQVTANQKQGMQEETSILKMFFFAVSPETGSFAQVKIRAKVDGSRKSRTF